MRRAMDQIRLLAPSMRPPMLPVVSSTKATSTRGAASFVATAGAAARVKARLPARIDIEAPPGPRYTPDRGLIPGLRCGAWYSRGNAPRITTRPLHVSGGTMQRHAGSLAVLLVLGLAGVGCNDGTEGQEAFQATLSGSEEVPPRPTGA